MSEIVHEAIAEAEPASASAQGGGMWRDGLVAAGTWLLAAAITFLLPDVIVWGRPTSSP